MGWIVASPEYLFRFASQLVAGSLARDAVVG